MSQGNRRAIAEIAHIIRDMMSLLKPDTHQVTLCGSYRRGEESIGDVDIVVHPINTKDYLNKMDEHVHMGWYGHGTNAGGRETWGETKRLCTYQGINFDVIIADQNQLGYKLWLSTGPKTANETMMILLKEKLSPVRMRDGYCWHVSYDRKHPKFEKANGYARLAKLHVPDESAFFKLLGMAFCHPQWRTEKYYRTYLYQNGMPSKELIEGRYVEGSKPILQQSLF